MVLYFKSHSITVFIERLIITVFDPDNESDTEVPYADIMITVRGVSTPELTQVSYLIAGEPKEVRDYKTARYLQGNFLPRTSNNCLLI